MDRMLTHISFDVFVACPFPPFTLDAAEAGVFVDIIQAGYPDSWIKKRKSRPSDESRPIERAPRAKKVSSR